MLRQMPYRTFLQISPKFDECLKIIACHSAIRANQALSDEQVKALLKDMDSCKNPSYCPHGRPTWVRWTRSSLEKSFSRI